MDLSVPRAQHIEIYNLSFSHVAETFDMHGTKMTGFLLPSSLPVVSFFLIKNVMYNFKFWKAIHFLHQKGIRVQMPLGNPSLDVKQLQNQVNMHPTVARINVRTLTVIHEHTVNSCINNHVRICRDEFQVYSHLKILRFSKYWIMSFSVLSREKDSTMDWDCQTLLLRWN